ncbi:MAG: hypothetical protein I3273_06235 [Candidatus Moeniiplasma glomeromycotorum]|nr:hypothetical protein [Candidatus Moeniiplasma glomeromycotorum]MCE8168015.1 hypothetical protein [Candidatus Moeniiplasma glomeromycotorum]MCE8169683.1 hypothetical protein [Candidatus Moeniiplasma glomeromycotorum]
MKTTLIFLTISLVIIIIAYLLRKSKKTKYKKETIDYKRDSDWNKVKEIPTINCFKCEECMTENNNCCANCSVNLSISEEVHCQEHNHNHFHYHSSEISQKLMIVPIIFGIIIIWVVKNVLICKKF